MAEAIVPRANIYDFDTNDLIPELENYVDNEDGIEGNPNEVPVVPATPEFNDKYLNVYLMLPREGE